MNELDALRIVSEHNGESIAAMLEAAKQAGFSDEMDNKRRFHSLYEQDYIAGSFVCSQPVTLTLKGKDRLELLRETAASQAKQQREKWVERIWCFLAGIASAVLAQIIVNLIGK